MATLAGRRQIVTVTHSRLLGVEDETGKMLWAVPLKVRYDMNIVTPILHGDVVVYSGYHEGTTAVRIVARGGTLAVERLWHNDAESMFMNSPVRRDGHLYGLAARAGRKGALVCIALADGASKWASPKMGDYASIVRVGDKLLVLTTGGDLLLAAAEQSAYRELGRSHLTDRPVWAHLALTADRIYLKDETHLMCFELPGR